MYYKIENKECEVYKKLHTMRTHEIEIQEKNKQAVKDKIGLDFEQFLGYYGQQNIRRVTQYCGFNFKEPDKVDLKIWKRSKENPEIFEPNRKTKLGREMDSFLLNGLMSSSLWELFEILELECVGKFCFPFMEISVDTIILYLGDKFEPQDKNIVEITKKEFDLYRVTTGHNI